MVAPRRAVWSTEGWSLAALTELGVVMHLLSSPVVTVVSVAVGAQLVLGGVARAIRLWPRFQRRYYQDQTDVEAARSKQDRWVFGDRGSGAYLLKHSWTNIVRHQLVPGTASPDDPDLADYWAERRKRSTPPLDGISLRLMKMQHGRCPLCDAFLLVADHEPQSPQEWEQWVRATRKAVRRDAIAVERGNGKPHDAVAHRLVHADCQRRSRTAVDKKVRASARP